VEVGQRLGDVGADLGRRRGRHGSGQVRQHAPGDQLHDAPAALTVDAGVVDPDQLPVVQ
jgi:hypothetical protein